MILALSTWYSGDRMKCANQRGQALVVVLLVMSVVLTVALSVVSRSITDITVSQKEEEALRAFSAAEAGVEKALIVGQPQAGTLGPSGASFNAAVAALAAGASEFALPLPVNSAESISVWFVAHDANGNLVCNASGLGCFTGRRLKVCWGDPTASSAIKPALQLSVLYTQTSDFSTARVARAGYDPEASRRGGGQGNQLDAPDGGSCTVDGKSFAYQKTIDMGEAGVSLRPNSSSLVGPLQARLKLLYNTDQAHPVGVSVNFTENGGSTLPSQGSKVDSVGRSGEASRRIVVNRIHPDLPPLFDFGVFAGSGDLAK